MLTFLFQFIWKHAWEFSVIFPHTKNEFCIRNFVFCVKRDLNDIEHKLL